MGFGLTISAFFAGWAKNWNNRNLVQQRACINIEKLLGLEESKQYQDDVAAIDVNLQVRRNGGCAIGDSTWTVRLSSDKINGDREVNFANKVSEEDECASDNADEDGRRWRSRKIMNDLIGELGDSERDLVLVPEDSVYVGLHCHGDSRRMGDSGFKRRWRRGFRFLQLQLVALIAPHKSHSHGI